MATLTIQPDATTGQDSMGYSGNTSLTWGTASILYFGGGSDDQTFSVLKFDLSALSGVTINSADLIVTNPSTRSGTNTINVHRILSGNSDWTESGCSWDNRKDGTTWVGSGGCGTAGTDFASTLLGTLTIPAGTHSGGEVWEIPLDTTEFTTLVSANYGIVVRAPSTAYVQWTYHSSDADTESVRPKLVVDYTAGGGSTGQIKVWNGSAFVAKPVKVYNGSTWVTKPVKYYNGTAWVTTTY